MTTSSTTPDTDVVVVGAGFAGLYALHRLRDRMNMSVRVFEAGDDVGGTWYWNRYPGARCDIESIHYSYSFDEDLQQEWQWSEKFAGQPEILRYLNHVADRFDLRKGITFGTRVIGVHWDDENSWWTVRTDTGETVTARWFISGAGNLSVPKKPEFGGIDNFRGQVLLTGNWPHEPVDFTGRRVAIIGTGATSVQLVPEIAARARELTVFQRTPIWVVPKIDVRFGALARRLFARVPATQRAVRAVTDGLYEFLVYVGVLRYDSVGRLNGAARLLAGAHRFASIRDRNLRRKLTPDYEFGCKRPTFSNSYYRTFTRPHVHLQADGIDRVEADGIVNADGTKTVLDTLVLATGFDLWEANFPAIEVIGRDGRDLGKWWRDTRFQAYQGVTVPRFPNFLSLASPYAFLGLNFFNTMDYQMRHMDRLFGELKRRGATTFEVTEEANARYLDQMTELLGDSLFTVGDCASARSYYYNPAGEATLLRPMTTRAALREASTYPVTDYEFA